MQCEAQLQALHSISADSRVLHVDANGGLCRISKKMNIEYKQLMNYAFLLKDFRDLNQAGVLINEVVTSRHDTMRIGEMFYLFKNNYLSF